MQKSYQPKWDESQVFFTNNIMCKYFRPITLLSKLSWKFFYDFKIGIKFFVYWNPYWIFVRDNLGLILALLQTLKPKSHETAHKNKKFC